MLDMIIDFKVPMYRFFSDETHANSMLNNGLVYFNTVKGFTTLEDEKFRDLDEGGHAFKVPTPMTRTGPGPWPEVIIAHSIKKRRIPDVWAFCGTCSPASSARKPFSVRVNHVIGFIRHLDYALQLRFNQQLKILFGPVSYYDEDHNAMSPHEQPPYFSKLAKYKDELEFRIIIIPPLGIEEIQPEVFKQPDPYKIFSKGVLLYPNK